MDLVVEEIFQKYSNNQEELTFDEWQQWFINLEGMKEVLDMKPHWAGGGGEDNSSERNKSSNRNNS